MKDGLRMSMRKLGTALAVMLLGAVTIFAMSSFAQDGMKMGKGMGQGGSAGASKTTSNPSTKAYAEVNQRMHKAMMGEFTGDADTDFIRSMIPHHQGAVDMARVALKYGKDPEVLNLANEIIASQEEQIAVMKKWLADHPK